MDKGMELTCSGKQIKHLHKAVQILGRIGAQGAPGPSGTACSLALK